MTNLIYSKAFMSRIFSNIIIGRDIKVKVICSAFNR